MKVVWTSILIAFVLVLSHTAAASSALDGFDAELSAEDQKELSEAMTPIGKLIKAAQYLAGLAIVLAVIAAGFVHMKGDIDSKQKTVTMLSRVLVGSILIFGAFTFTRVFVLA